MPTLSTEQRNKLERTVVEARRIAEVGARAALEAFAVGHHEPFAHMTAEQRKRRTHLRARARQLGDQQDKNGRLELSYIAHECAYEHWHRMLFARFLAENSLLIEPDSGVAISLDECKELAKDAGTDLWTLAGRYAQGMLPQIFRPDDPLLQITLAKEHQLDLERKLDSLPVDVFTASDSLGWCYQFWQAEKKDEVNASGEKIGADELPAVTQLFTEDYMVGFLLDNTLGAWWWGRCAAVQGSRFRAQGCKTEEDCRRLIALPECLWKYLRFLKDEKGGWRPAAGMFDGWPKTTKELKCLDPCMGSGHFVVAMFERLVALRMAEENLGEKEAVASVIRDNLFGLEIDPRCTQIGAFNLALAAWRRVGHCTLPEMSIACSGLAPNSTKDDWVKLAGDSEKLQRGMERLFQIFHNAPVLGSLINPRTGGGDLLIAGFHELQPLLEKALTREGGDDAAHEMAVAARGIALAAEILAERFTLVATNVPYLARGRQCEILKVFCERHAEDAKTDLATTCVQRCLDFCHPSGIIAVVSPQNWLNLPSYGRFRQRLVRTVTLLLQARLGPGAFDTISGEVVNVALTVWSVSAAAPSHSVIGWDAVDAQSACGKASVLLGAACKACPQADYLRFPDSRITLQAQSNCSLLSDHAVAPQGIKTGDDQLFRRCWWELSCLGTRWRFFQGTPDRTQLHDGMSFALDWANEGRGLARLQGQAGWGKKGVVVKLMGDFTCSLHSGELFDSNVTVIVPKNTGLLPAIWMYCSSGAFGDNLKGIEGGIKANNATAVKVVFDVEHWRGAAATTYPKGLPVAFSNDPTQWVFTGIVCESAAPLQVAVGLMLGYEWPEQDEDVLRRLTAEIDDDGIVCLPSFRGEDQAAERLRRLLAKAYGKAWTATKEHELITTTGSTAADLEEWLRNDFFQQHCDLFHHRPFVWHIWDGRKRDGFHVLVNYHKLADGTKGRKLLEKLTHAYLNDWIARQRDGVKRGEGGAEERLAAAEELKVRLEAIIEGEPPCDIFVRWKPLHQQPIGWEPDINDGVRLNIRPFLAQDLSKGRAGAGILRWKPNIKWDKDRGKEPDRPKVEFPWFWKWDETTQDFMGGREFDGNRWNDCHYTNAAKQKVRKDVGR